MHKVTIIIPTYNGQNFISATINSCLNQTYQDIKIIVVNDNSTDRTKDILDGYAENIKVVENHQNLGLPRSINKVILEDDSDFFIYLGHDDILLENHVEIMLSEFDDDTSAVHCNSRVIDENDIQGVFTRDNKVQFKKTRDLVFELSIDNFISVIGMMNRTISFKSIGGWDEGYDLYGEWFYYIRLSTTGYIKYTDKTHALYRIHSNNITKSLHNNRKSIEALHAYKNRCRNSARDISNFSFTQNITFMFFYFYNELKYKFQIFLSSQ